MEDAAKKGIESLAVVKPRTGPRAQILDFLARNSARGAAHELAGEATAGEHSARR